MGNGWRSWHCFVRWKSERRISLKSRPDLHRGKAARAISSQGLSNTSTPASNKRPVGVARHSDHDIEGTKICHVPNGLCAAKKLHEQRRQHGDKFGLAANADFGEDGFQLIARRPRGNAERA